MPLRGLRVPKVPGVPEVPRVLVLRVLVLVLGVLAANNALAQETRITVARPAVLIATIDATCDRCDWATEGREAVMLTLSLDGKYSQHLPLTRTGRAEYKVLLGTVDPGAHSIRVAVDRDRSARELRDVETPVTIATVQAVLDSDPGFVALSLAPFVYERLNTAGRFSDVPVFAWYEPEPTARGTRYRYSVIFTNEDGGTPADRLMATWGRTTDIEYIYSVEVDRTGSVLDEDYQGPKHEVLKFQGRRERGHPLLFVVTDNNMVSDTGTATVRYAPAPVALPLLSAANTTREAIMDANRWLYTVMLKELEREKKIVPDAPPGKGVIPDPRRYIYLDACAEVGNNALAFSVLVNDYWIPSDRGIVEYRVARDGCFRAAVPVPAKTDLNAAKAVRIQAFERPNKTVSSAVRLRTIAAVFHFDHRFSAHQRVVPWQGAIELRPGGPGHDIPLK